MLCAAAVTAQFVGGKATRDALFLSSLDVSTLPAMLMATSVGSILVVTVYGHWASRIGPGRLVPAAFIASGALFVLEWLTRAFAPSATAVVVYLHISAASPLLTSGFWLIASEGFDPRTAKKRFGQIAGAGTIGGLAGALVAERVAMLFGVPAMLLFLAGFQTIAAVLVHSLASGMPGAGDAPLEDETQAPVPVRSGIRVVVEAPHLRWLVALVLLGTTSAALVEYVFKARAVETFGPGDHLLRFFALYYAAISVLTFAVQVGSSRAALERFGLGLTTSTPSIALVAGSLGSLVVPGFGAVLVARASELIFRGSLFRTGYELFFTPIPPAEKRAAKSVVDVAVDRLGDAAGGGLIRLIVMVAPAAQSSTIVACAVALSLAAIVAASRLHRWYVQTLGNSLIEQGRGIDLAQTRGDSMRAVLHSMRRHQAEPRQPIAPRTPTTAAPAGGAGRWIADPELQDIMALRSRERQRAVAVLARPTGLTPALVSHVIPLLAWEPLADYALFALRKIAEERVGELTDAMLDPRNGDAVRSRLARVFSVCVSQRAADGLILALDDRRFEVRYQAARSLVAIVEKNPRVRIDADRIYEVVLEETEFLEEQAGQRLAHVFALLSLVLPREPLQIAFRSLDADDRRLRGTSLEYLEGVLPPAIRRRLWPFLVRRRADRGPRRIAGGATAGIPGAPLRLAVAPALTRAAGQPTLRGLNRFGA